MIIAEVSAELQFSWMKRAPGSLQPLGFEGKLVLRAARGACDPRRLGLALYENGDKQEVRSGWVCFFIKSSSGQKPESLLDVFGKQETFLFVFFIDFITGQIVRAQTLIYHQFIGV